jgi:CIC family chloride channel protein
MATADDGREGRGSTTMMARLRRVVALLQGHGDDERDQRIGRWIVLSLIVGVVAGLGAVGMQWGIDSMNHLALRQLGGFGTPGLPTEGGTLAQEYAASYRWWLFPLIPALGGLVTGLIVYTFAPEAEGHGTDAVIRAFHREGGLIRARVPIVKIIASAITLGTGGSGGREGPIAQVGAGFGAWLATALRVSDYERRLLVLAGAAGGIGAIFRAPLGGALVVCELLYRNMEFEYEAVVPAVLTSVVAYSLYSLFNGWDPMFDTSRLLYDHPRNLVIYLVLGVVVAALGWAYVRVFYGLRDRVFNRLPLPHHVRPAVGGLLTGLLALLAPQAIGLGYGWVQMGLQGRLGMGDYVAGALGKILATGFTISSGGSGGVFGPAVVIGGFTGGAVGTYFSHLLPDWGLHPQSFILVGMAAFFGGAAKAPIGAILMISEMTTGYGLLVPLMLTTAVAILLVPKRVSIYEEQVDGSVNSPAHFGRYLGHMLRALDRTARQERGRAASAPTIAPGGAVPELFPILDPANPARILGLVPRDALARALLQTHEGESPPGRAVPLGALGEATFLDAEVGPDSALAGTRVAELDLGEAGLVVAIRRGKRTFVATGGTRLEAGDHVIVIAAPEHADRVLQRFRAKAP